MNIPRSLRDAGAGHCGLVHGALGAKVSCAILLAWTGLIFAASGASAESCVDNPHVLGTERTIVVEPWTLPRVGTFQYPQTRRSAITRWC
ncbi:MAG: hypothetical protein WA851_18365 [Xanthobacteraceae bacterium]